MKLEAAIRQSPCGAARRPTRRGGFTVAMKIKGKLRRVASVDYPRIEGFVKQFDLDSGDWSPVAAKEKLIERFK